MELKMTALELATLRAIAAEATPSRVDGGQIGKARWITSVDGEQIAMMYGPGVNPRAHADTAFMVAASPAAILAVIAEVESRTALVEERHLALRNQLGFSDGLPPGWFWGIVDENGGRGWRKVANGRVYFASGEYPMTSAEGIVPGGWACWTANCDGDLEEQIATNAEDGSGWCDRDAVLAAEAYITRSSATASE